MTRAFLGLGSNLGDRPSHLRTAVGSLDDVVRVSPVYETDPVGGPDDQGAYLNLVVELENPARAMYLRRGFEPIGGAPDARDLRKLL